jgi:hypothetical protein
MISIATADCEEGEGLDVRIPTLGLGSAAHVTVEEQVTGTQQPVGGR